MTMYRYRPSEKAHVVADEESGTEGLTLCGIAHEGNVRDVGDNPNEVLPTYLPYCQRCRASYVTQVMANLEVDVTNLSEGDVIEYWEQNDPTDASVSFCFRKTGKIVEVPPWTITAGDEDYTIKGKYEVCCGKNIYARARFDRIWRVNDERMEMTDDIFE